MESTNDIFSFSRLKQYTWCPQPDITAYELAQAIPVLFYNGLEDPIERLPNEVKRHFCEIGAQFTE